MASDIGRLSFCRQRKQNHSTRPTIKRNFREEKPPVCGELVSSRLVGRISDTSTPPSALREPPLPSKNDPGGLWLIFDSR
jgi:hypothetical protein